MGKIILVTGGARSGKSTYAEELAKNSGENIMYIATAIPFDEEMEDRIKKHQESRPSEWFTYEGYKDLDIILNEKGDNFQGVLLDCVTVMTTNNIFEYPEFDENNIEIAMLDKIQDFIKNEFIKLIDVAKQKNLTLIMVTNELGSGLVPESSLGRAFRDIAGRINQIIAKQADEVYLLVAGIPVKIK